MNPVPLLDTNRPGSRALNRELCGQGKKSVGFLLPRPRGRPISRRGKKGCWARAAGDSSARKGKEEVRWGVPGDSYWQREIKNGRGKRKKKTEAAEKR